MSKRNRSRNPRPAKQFGPVAPSFESQAKQLAQQWLFLSAPEGERTSFTGLSAVRFGEFVLVMQFELGRCVGVVAVERAYAETFMTVFQRAAKGADFALGPITDPAKGNGGTAGVDDLVPPEFQNEEGTFTDGSTG